MFRLVAFLALLAGAFAQDPAQGWMGYAKATTKGGSRILYIEAKWKNLNNPREGGAFFSPWFGIEASDNLNLIQPVNPWSGDGWSIYNEYFQWSPVHNENSQAASSSPGDVLFGSVKFNPSEQSYSMVHTDMQSGASIKTTIPVQQSGSGGYKNYTIVYFVMEKTWPCAMYPPDDIVTFYDIKIKWEDPNAETVWTTNFVDDNCNCRAHIDNSTSVSITWDSTSSAQPSQAAMMRSIAAAKQQTLHPTL